MEDHRGPECQGGIAADPESGNRGIRTQSGLRPQRSLSCRRSGEATTPHLVAVPPLACGERASEDVVECDFTEIENPILLSGGQCASSGMGAGPVVHVRKEADLNAVPPGAVLVARDASPPLCGGHGPSEPRGDRYRECRRAFCLGGAGVRGAAFGGHRLCQPPFASRAPGHGIGPRQDGLQWDGPVHTGGPLYPPGFANRQPLHAQATIFNGFCVPAGTGGSPG